MTLFQEKVGTNPKEGSHGNKGRCLLGKEVDIHNLGFPAPATWDIETKSGRCQPDRPRPLVLETDTASAGCSEGLADNGTAERRRTGKGERVGCGRCQRAGAEDPRRPTRPSEDSGRRRRSLPTEGTRVKAAHRCGS